MVRLRMISLAEALRPWKCNGRTLLEAYTMTLFGCLHRETRLGMAPEEEQFDHSHGRHSK